MGKKLTALFLTFCMISCCIIPQAAADPAETKESDGGDSMPVMQEIYEAEDAVLVNATTGNTLDDYSADAYVDSIKAGGSTSFSVTVPRDGNYGVRLRYSNGSGSPKSLNVYINGELLRETTLTTTVNWDTWDVKMEGIALKEGKNTITYQNDGTEDSMVKLDKIAMSFLYEAEDGEYLNSMKGNNDHTGYSGTGFAAGFQNTNQGVKFNINALAAGEYTLVMRYAAGDTDSNGQSVSLIVNGDNTQQDLNTQRDWDKWADWYVNIELKEGDNEVIIRKDNDDDGSINLDYITVKQKIWNYVGKVEKAEGSGTSELTFTCDNSVVKLTSIDENIVKVWVDPEGKFSRKYESFAVVNDAINPQKLTLSDKTDYYEFVTGEVTVRVYKDPLKIVYLDKNGDVILENENDSMGWNSDGELKVNNKIVDGEQFYGLGEKVNSYNHTGRKLTLWSCDAYGEPSDGGVSSWDEGRWYFATPYYTSSNGYSIYFDNTSRTTFDFGNTDPTKSSFGSYNPYPGGDLVYYFIYGPEQKQLVKSYTDLTGKSFFAPDWAYGNLQCHYGYTQKDVERVAQTYRDKEIPLDVMMVDIEWYEYLCTPTQWNKVNFPDPDGMISLLDSLNLKFGYINDPNVTNRDNNADFVAGDTNGYFVKNMSGSTRLVNWPWGEASGLTDFFNPNAASWWASQTAKTLSQGVDCLWLDMNEPAKYNSDWLFWNEDGKAYGTLAEVKNAYAINHQKTIYNEVTKDNSRTLLITRSGSAGTQRYASPWTGDIQGSWESLHQQIMMGTSLSTSGYNYWGYDIGGFFGSISNDLYKRWVESATFTPVHRFHYCAGVEEKEPWTHDSEDVSKKYINLRYTLQPYMYSYTADNIMGIGIEDEYGEGGTGIPLVRSMFMEFPTDTATQSIDTQYMCGQSFLVAPVVESSTTKQVYLPEGNWYDYDDGFTVYGGQQTINYDAPEDLLPVFVKEGSIVPMQSERQYMNDPTADPNVTLDVYPTIDNGSFDFTLYEDDGETQDYLEGEYATTKYDCTVERGSATDKLTLNIGARTGSFTDIPERSYIAKLHTCAYGNTKVTLDGTELTKCDSMDALNSAESGFYTEKSTGICYVKVADTKAAATIVLTGDAGTNTGMIYEAEEGTVTGGESAAVTDGTGFKGLVNGSNVEFSNIITTNNGDFGVEIRYAGGKEGSTITLTSGDQTCTVKAESSELTSAVGVLSLGSEPSTVTVTSNDADVIFDKFIITNKPTEITTITEYTANAANGTVTGSATLGASGAILNAANDTVTLPDIVCAVNGTYSLKLKYYSTAEASVTVSCGTTSTTVTLPAAKNGGLLNETAINVAFAAGVNSVKISLKSGAGLTIVGADCPLEPYSVSTRSYEGTIVNPGFEEGSINGWSITDLTGRTGGYGVDSFDSYSGDKKFYYFDGDGSVEKELSQQPARLADGWYIVKAKTKLYNSTAECCEIRLTSGENSSAATIKQSGIWETTTSAPICVTGNQLKISFYFKAPGGSSLQLDDVTLYKITPESGDISTDYVDELIADSESCSIDNYEKDGWLKYMTGIAIAKRMTASGNVTAPELATISDYLNKAKAALVEISTLIPGDMDFDGKVTVSDVVTMRKLIMGGKFSENELKAGDFDNNGTLTVSDVIALRQLIMAG